MLPPLTTSIPELRSSKIIRLILILLVVGAALLAAYSMNLLTLPWSAPSAEQPPTGGEVVGHNIARFWEGSSEADRLYFPKEEEGWSGPACVQMVLTYYGKDPTQEQMAEELETDESGTLPEKMTYPFEQRKFNVESGGKLNSFDEAKAKLEYFMSIDRPVIILIRLEEKKDDRRYMVVVGYDEKGIYVNDPSASDGEHKYYSYDWLRDHWGSDKWWMLIGWR